MCATVETVPDHLGSLSTEKKDYRLEGYLMPEDDVIEMSVRRAIGEELRRAREANGWTRKKFVDRLPFAVHVQTIAGYEKGATQCTTTRFIELCETMGVSAPDVMAWGMQRANSSLPLIGIQVDLHAVIADKSKELLALRRWARRRLEIDDSTGVARLSWETVKEMGLMFGFGVCDFVKRITLFTPGPHPR
jgi:transcriptional regulator with XRE-family HTH domain